MLLSTVINGFYFIHRILFFSYYNRFLNLHFSSFIHSTILLVFLLPTVIPAYVPPIVVPLLVLLI